MPGASEAIIKDFTICHDDFTLKPKDGIMKEHTFPWVGFTQYLHVTTGLPHTSKAPRVTLIHRQFVASTAKDMLQLPKNYKLGNIVFGDYEREEHECDLSKEQLRIGLKCARAYIEIPVQDITPHPEYSRFGVGNSLALVKLIRPMKSVYMIPICLPSAAERRRNKVKKVVFMVDYISTVPKDFDSEKIGKKTLQLYTHRECRKHRMKSKLTSEGVTHVLCTSGCGVRVGAPIASQNADGMFELVGITAGGAACAKRSMRNRLNVEPPLYIDVYPYVAWIINVITAHILPLPYPHTFQLMEGGANIGIKKGYRRQAHTQSEGWRARFYMKGKLCFQSAGKLRRNSNMIYSERFEVNADPPGKLNLIIKINAGPESRLVCAKILLPNRYVIPNIQGINGPNVTISFHTGWFPYTFYYALGLHARNSTT